uniref:E3 ubiquitin-protein ligase RNF14 isoform X2 n=1 Tax=Myxine glutinosa TaxID=7769 RepID=UPI00358F5290
MSEDQEAQENELLALSGIYEEDTFHRAETRCGGEFFVCLELPDDFSICIPGSGEGQHKEVVCKVKNLPPVMLHFELPKNYPSRSPPMFTLSCKWLTRAQLSKLCWNLDELWEQNCGSEIIFIWTQFLLEELLNFLEIESPLALRVGQNDTKGQQQQQQQHNINEHDKTEQSSSKAHTSGSRSSKVKITVDHRAVQDVESVSVLYEQILDYDRAQRQKAFDASLVSCQVCFGEKLGSACMLFLTCNHVCCCDCLRSFFEMCIEDGNVQNLKCPDLGCESVATPTQVRQLVGEQLFARYDRLLLQAALDVMEDVMYCPRLFCQTPVMLEPGGTMGRCPACSFAFCTICRQCFHGISACRINKEQTKVFVEDYLQADDEGKLEIEKRFGKRVVRRMLDERSSHDWLENNSQPCPICSTNIQKRAGCNKMRCSGCKHSFCWLCLSVLSREDPYNHFNDPTSPCHTRLLEGEFPEEEEDIVEYADEGFEAE